MFIAVCAPEAQKTDLLNRSFPPGIELVFMQDPTAGDLKNIDAIIDYTYTLPTHAYPLHIPVFKHALLQLLSELPENYIRINAWPGFLQRPVLELAFTDKMTTSVEKIIQALQIPFIRVPDIIGLIAARSISMIINEAWYALADNVSSKAEIDTAMKLGTNYPYGPFEWGNKIGLHHIADLLNKLAEKEPRYIPAPHMLDELAVGDNLKTS